MGTREQEGGLRRLRGLGPALEKRLGEAGFADLRSLAMAVPSRYREVLALSRPDAGLLGRELRLRIIVRGARRLRTRRGLAFTQVEAHLASDPELRVTLRFFGQPWLARSLNRDEERLVDGRLERKGRKYELVAPRLLPRETVFAPGRLLVPQRVSPVEGMSAERFGDFARAAIEELGEELEEELPAEQLERLNLLPLPQALLELHAPEGETERLERARRRLAYIEAHALLAQIRQRRAARAKKRSWPVPPNEKIEARIRARLPFALSEEQDRVAAEIGADLAADSPMTRLLMGDVACGKTLVAVHACLAAIAAGHKAVLLVPTEILAEQHVSRISQWLAGSRVPVLCFSAGQSRAQRAESLALLAGPSPCLAVGTHALLSDEVQISRLGLLVIDEQQRFGVVQRAALWREDEGRWPHVLVMSATPIPRTLATTLFGDLDISEIRKPPQPRPKPVTELLPERAWPEVLRRIEAELAAGGRAFVVCPRIGAGEQEEADGALATHRELAARLGAGLIHGRMPSEERRRAQQRFRSGETPVLVGTTVLEVGIDVPEATLMVVRGAERLGLSTLHQLRGRVGRGEKPARCLLLRDPAAERLDVLADCGDGFELAEADLRQRGAGDLSGVLQSGHRRFRCLDPLQDLDLLRAAGR
ncbi:MAG: ATP-dependent DNA helicase RecG [Planctomycetota bacterium]|nr:MAG: ATP-dependent DNA helicase RecG [Planctomycetota bacterium]